MASRDGVKQSILANAAEINQLHAHIRQAVSDRFRDAKGNAVWKQACADFHERYNELAFPGGVAGAAQRILEGDPAAIDAGICFLELRPYFFRSQYLFKTLLRKIKQAPLSEQQRYRVQLVIERQAERKATVKSSSPTAATGTGVVSQEGKYPPMTTYERKT